ncbi:MAG: hypothetical protein E6Q40_15115 [Cupriavidus sp.]|nr:MAG: hypothetical protein E6Q40_15115 [Cupriavidus sp.]
MTEYHELIGVIELSGDEPFALPRSNALLAAVEGHRDFRLIQRIKTAPGVEPALELIIVDVECHEVPSMNAAGIEFRERLALSISADEKTPVEVAALRQGFPILIHQNTGVRNGPASLCLYFEPDEEIQRTWTPQRFLRRIQWWLVMSARGELHTADQPLEHLFFRSKFELILPWNFGQLKANPNLKPVAERGPQRGDGLTCFIHFIPSHEQPRTGTLTHIELSLPPVVQGFVERDPLTLGALFDLLSGRGVDLLTPLKNSLMADVSDAGVPVGNAQALVVLVLNIPMARDAASPPTAMARRAFVIDADLRELGVAAGALMEHNGRYFRDVASAALGVPPSDAWRPYPALPMELLYTNDAAAFRSQSSITEAGPRGVIVGAGSLGSQLLTLWGRSGWGQWTAIDKDHIKPHNLARHIALTQHLGEPKVKVVAELVSAFSGGAVAVNALDADAGDESNEPVRAALRGTELVVDASAALGYPRYASGLDDVARHASVFLTPDGNGAVLMVEDAARAIRLRSLEAQYYRALLRQPWGQHHLDRNLGTFWSGRSCRDISVALPYSRVVAHAATLSEQVMSATRQPTALVRVWGRDPSTGAVAVHEVAALPERKFDLGSLPVFIDEGVIADLHGARQQALPVETGGVLLGYVDFNIKAIVVVDILTAPPDSGGTRSWFERGTEGLAAAVDEASRRTAGIVGYVGEWHSHPPGHDASPSDHDLIQLIELALRMYEDGLPVLQLIVGDGDDIRVIQGEVRG